MGRLRGLRPYAEASGDQGLRGLVASTALASDPGRHRQTGELLPDHRVPRLSHRLQHRGGSQGTLRWTWGSVELGGRSVRGSDLRIHDPSWPPSMEADICDGLFEEEVNYALTKSEGWMPSRLYSTAIPPETLASLARKLGRVERLKRPRRSSDSVQWKAGRKKGASGRQFKTLWFDDNLDGNLPKPGTSSFAYGPKGHERSLRYARIRWQRSRRHPRGSWQPDVDLDESVGQ